MNNENTISGKVLDAVQEAISKGENWMVYNDSLYSLAKDNIYFFKDRDAALSFSESNYSDYDRFQIVHFKSVEDLNNQLPKWEPYSKEDLLDPNANGLHSREGNSFTDALIEHWEQQQEFINKLKMNVMNEQNFEYLKDNIKYLGFGEQHNGALEANLKMGNPEFTLTSRTEVNKKPFEVNLHFRKSGNSDMYFFNSYNASLQRTNGEKLDQTFYLNKGKGITAKEAYNLLEGRSVFKELSTKDGQAYKAWVQLDFEKKDNHNNHDVKQFHENYGYNLKEAISKFAVSDLTDPEKGKALMQSLQKGNVQSVSIEKDGTATRMFIEANPQFKTVNLYDAQFRRVPKEALGEYQSISRAQSKEVKQEQQQDVKQDEKKTVKQAPADDAEGSKKKNTYKRKVSV